MKEIQRSLGGGIMKIKDMQTLPEFFGVELGSPLWVEGKYFRVFEAFLISDDYDSSVDGRALVGCLTGQLKWSTTEPISEDEEELLREIAAWHNNWETLSLTYNGTIYRTSNANNDHAVVPFDVAEKESKAYEVLAPILEKYGEIDLDEYREATAHDNY